MRSYQVELSRTIDLTQTGQVQVALERYESFNRRSSKGLLYYLEKGELLRLAGRYQESQEAWALADTQVKKWESAAVANPERLVGLAASLVINDATRPYEGEDFEKVMITTRMALNHLALGEWDKARVAIKRTHEREALIAQIREKQVQQAQEEAEKRGEKRSFRELDGYPVQTIDSPEVNALRNSYQSAFSHYLAGFVYEALGEPSLAAAGYRQAIELQPGVPLLDQGLAGLDSRVADRDNGRTELLVVVETGVAPARVSQQFNVPIFSDAGLLIVPVSFPVIRDQGFAPGATTVSLEGIGPANVAAITSVDLMARRALRDDMPWIMLRAITRATAKAIIQRQARKRDDSGIAGAIAIIGSILTEKADERSWRMLPAQIGVARASVPHGRHRLTVQAGGASHEFEVNVEGRYALVSIRMLGAEAYLATSPATPGQNVRHDTQHIGLRSFY